VVIALALGLVCGGAVVGFLVADRLDSQRGRWLCKPVASATFVALALVHGAPATTFARACVAAFALSFVGDVCLVPKSRAWFRVGLFAFLLAHVAFAVAFVARGVDVRAIGGAAVILAVIAAVVLRWLWPHVDAAMRAPVALYVVAITVMVACAAGTFAARGGVLVAGGAAAFYLSDLSVARHTFVKRQWVNRLWGLPLYYGAQLALAFAATATATATATE
jgi:uncharacterized membrane protein YhhN